MCSVHVTYIRFSIVPCICTSYVCWICPPQLMSWSSHRGYLAYLCWHWLRRYGSILLTVVYCCFSVSLQRLSCTAAVSAAPSIYSCPTAYDFVGTDAILFSDFKLDCCSPSEGPSVSGAAVIGTNLHCVLGCDCSKV